MNIFHAVNGPKLLRTSTITMAVAAWLTACSTSAPRASQGNGDDSSSNATGGGSQSSQGNGSGDHTTNGASTSGNGTTASGVSTKLGSSTIAMMGDAGAASKCPGYAAPPPLGTTISLAPTSSTTSEQILPLGCMHLLSNRWTDPMATETLFLNNDSSFGFTWSRGGTGGDGGAGAGANPNYPELEFGVNPWGQTANGDLTAVSTTDLLPMQYQNIRSASMTVDVDANIATPSIVWDLAFEMWLSPADPTKGKPADPTVGSTDPVYEIMVFLGNQSMYYPPTPMCDPSAPAYNCGSQITDGSNNYTLYFASTQWGNPQYTYLQYRNSVNGGNGQFNGTLDIYKFLQAVNPAGALYVKRFELGVETYRGSQGTTTIKNISFEVNGTTESALMKY